MANGFKCDVCGGKVVSSASEGWFLCENCGTEYPLEWMKAKFQKTQTVSVEGKVEIGNIAGVDNLLKRARAFFAEGDYDKAEVYCNRVFDIEADNAQAKALLRDVENARNELYRRNQEKSMQLVQIIEKQQKEAKDRQIKNERNNAINLIRTQFNLTRLPEKSQLEYVLSFCCGNTKSEIANYFKEFADKLVNGAKIHPENYMIYISAFMHGHVSERFKFIIAEKNTYIDSVLSDNLLPNEVKSAIVKHEKDAVELAAHFNLHRIEFLNKLGIREHDYERVLDKQYAEYNTIRYIKNYVDEIAKFWTAEVNQPMFRYQRVPNFTVLTTSAIKIYPYYFYNSGYKEKMYFIKTEIKLTKDVIDKTFLLSSKFKHPKRVSSFIKSIFSTMFGF